MVNRRTLLRSVPFAAVPATTGCLSPLWTGGSTREPGGVYGNNGDDRSWELTVRITRLDGEAGEVLEAAVSEEIPAGESPKLYQVVDPGTYRFHGTNGRDSSTIDGRFSPSDDPEYPVRGPDVSFIVSGADSVTGSRGAGE